MGLFSNLDFPVPSWLGQENIVYHVHCSQCINNFNKIVIHFFGSDGVDFEISLSPLSKLEYWFLM